MVEASKVRIEQQMTEMVNQLNKNHLRKMQGDMYRCAARCYDDENTSLESTHYCIEKCSVPLNQANNYVQTEIQHFQNGLQRCVMDCYDSARDRLVGDTSQELLDKTTIVYEKCVVNCMDKHMELMPAMMKVMKEVLARGKPPPHQLYHV